MVFKQKITIVIGTMNHGGAEILVYEFLKYIYKNGGSNIELVVFYDKGKNGFIDELKELGCRVSVLNQKSIYSFRNIFRLASKIKKSQIVHVHLFPAFYYSVFANVLNRFYSKLVYTEHCTYNRRMNYFFTRSLDRLFYSQYNSIISISNEVSDKLLRNYPSLKNKLTLINNAIDLSKYQSVKPYSKSSIHADIKDDDFLIIQVSGFRKQKDQQTLIRAMCYTPDNFKLILVGDGVTIHECKSLVRTNYLEKRIFFLGIRNDVPNLFKTSNLAVLSTYYEGMPLVLLEIMASKILLVASDVPGTKELVEGSGLLFKRGDEFALSKFMIDYYEHPEKFQHFINNAQNKVERYSMNYFVTNHYRVYTFLFNDG